MDNEKQKLLNFLDSDDPEIVCLYLNIIENEYGEELIKKHAQISKLTLSEDNRVFIKRINNKRFYFYKVEKEWDFKIMKKF
jgi:hypothetical protein